MRRSIPFALFFLPLVLAAGGCEFEAGDWGNSNRFKEDFSYDFKLPPGGRLEVESFNGSIEIVGWDSDAVQVRGTKNASRQEMIKELSIDAKGDDGEVRLRAVRPMPNCNCGVSFTIKVPRKTRIDRADTSNASVRLESIDAPARVQTSNGSIKIYDVSGDLQATTSNASIEAEKLSGSAILRTSNGRIHGDGIKGTLEARTSNASIDVTVTEADPAHPMILNSSNGSITLNLTSWKSNEIRASTSNSSINLRLPESLDARVHASTSNGSITTDYEVTTSHISKTLLEGKIGNGGPMIDLQTSNGAIRLSKR
jgi:hypothetical protein